ncbi:MAG: hypothetical protein GEU28_12340 [Dehalococcoidia bacterium]|nr:hypothetical protein [Dehalococcoidia bacterium]
MTENPLLYEKDGAVARVTLNRTGAINAFTIEMRDLLWEHLGAIRDDPDIRVAIFRGAGDRGFSAGADIAEFGSGPSLYDSRRARRERDVWGLMLTIDKPLIAQLHGFALGAGLELSLCCDFRIAADDAVLGLPEVKLGYIPSAGGTQLLPRAVRSSLAREMILTGEPIGSRRALAAGLVHAVTTTARLDDEASLLAAKLCAQPRSAIGAAKRALAASLETSLESGLAVERALAGALQAQGAGDGR